MQNSYPLVELSSSALTLTTPAISAGASVLAELNPLSLPINLRDCRNG